MQDEWHSQSVNLTGEPMDKVKQGARYLNSSQIKQSIKSLVPKKIAVAYLGIDWKSLIDCSKLTEVIVSPTIGSNPRAIEELAKQIGWENVYFLENLHSKLYISKNKAIVGSANWSSNGLGQSLYEAGIELTDPELIDDVFNDFKALREVAEESFPTLSSKKARLQKLHKEHARALAARLPNSQVEKDQSSKSFLEYELDTGIPFQVTYYTPGGVNEELSEETEALLYDNWERIDFAADDKVEVGDWFLTWEAKKSDNKPHKKRNLTWFYVEHVVDNGITPKGDDEGYEYTKIAIQNIDVDELEQPFEITKEFQEHFRKVITTPEFNQFIGSDGQTFLNKDIAADTSKFIKSIRASMKE